MAAAVARLRALGQAVGLTPLATAGSTHVLCNFSLGIESVAAAAGLRCALEEVCADHAASTYSFTIKRPDW